MNYKKLAMFVEGQTELVFIEKLLREYIKHEKLAISSFNNSGGNVCTRFSTLIAEDPVTSTTEFQVLIYNSCADNRVFSDVLDQYTSLKNNGYEMFIGIRDLYPDYVFSELNDAINSSKQIIHAKGFSNISIVYATMEVETWFLSEQTHYTKMHSSLSIQNVINNFEQLQDLSKYEEILTSPAITLNAVYQLTNLHYTKRLNNVSLTIDNLDYENLYLNCRKDLKSLNKLFSLLDIFFTNI